MRNLSPKVKTSSVLAPVAVTATVSSSGIDTADFGSNGFLVHVGAGTLDATNKITPTMMECDTLGGSYTQVADADIYQGAPTPAVASSLVHLEYRGSKRFLKMKLVVAATVTNPCSVASIQSHAELQPPL